MTLLRYLSRLFLARMLMVLFGLAALLQTLDLFDRAGELLQRGGIADVVRYTLLSLPTLLGQIAPLAVLVSAMLTFRRLASTLEMTALRAAGMGAWRILSALAPAGALTAAVQLALVLGIAPYTERMLADWWDARGNDGGPVALSQRAWLRSNGDILGMDAVSVDGTRLEGVLLVRRDAEGRALLRIDARKAEHGRLGWQFGQVRIARPGMQHPILLEELPWPDGPSPAALREAARPTQAQTPGRLLAGLRGEGVVTRGPAFYAMRVQATAAMAVAPFIMLLLAMPAAFGLPRAGGAGRRALTGLVLGLGYLVIAGLLTSLGEAGALAPALAAWSAPASFAMAGLWLLWREEA